MKVGKRIRQIRQARGLTVKEVAQAMGIKREAVYALESDKGSPRLDTIERAAIALGVCTANLLGASDIPSSQELSWFLKALIPAYYPPEGEGEIIHMISRAEIDALAQKLHNWITVRDRVRDRE